MPSSASFVRWQSSSASIEIGSPRVTVSGPQTATKPWASAKASVRSASIRCCRRAARRLAAVDRAGERERLVDELLAALAVRRPVQRERELHAQAAAQPVDRRAARGVRRRERVQAGERLLEHGDELGVDEPGRERAERAGQRRLREALGIVEPARVTGRGAQRAQRAVDVAGAHARLAEALRELPRARLVGRQRGGDADRALVQARRLLVGELADGALRGARGVVDRALGAALAGGLQEVVGDLGEVRLEVVAVGVLERLGGEQVQPRAAVGAEALQQRVAHERVRELEAPAARGRRTTSPPRSGASSQASTAGRARRARWPASAGETRRRSRRRRRAPA